MSEKKYVAYVGSYTHGSSRQGIHVYDVDVENGTLTERSSVEVSNASHMAVSKNGKYLYSIEDEGVAVFKRDKNGDLSRINSVNIDGMRGCFLSTDVDGKYLYVAGYHDGKVTVVHAPTTNDHDCTDAEPAKHTQPFTVGKGFGDRDREFIISFVKQPISVNRLQSDVIIVHQNLTLTLLNLT